MSVSHNISTYGKWQTVMMIRLLITGCSHLQYASRIPILAVGQESRPISRSMCHIVQ